MHTLTCQKVAQQVSFWKLRPIYIFLRIDRCQPESDADHWKLFINIASKMCICILIQLDIVVLANIRRDQHRLGPSNNSKIISLAKCFRKYHSALVTSCLYSQISSFPIWMKFYIFPCESASWLDAPGRVSRYCLQSSPLRALLHHHGPEAARRGESFARANIRVLSAVVIVTLLNFSPSSSLFRQEEVAFVAPFSSNGRWPNTVDSLTWWADRKLSLSPYGSQTDADSSHIIQNINIAMQIAFGTR